MDKHVYLDIDMDYFIAPIEKVSVDNIRLYYDKTCSLLPVKPVVERLRDSGLIWQNEKISCFTNHKTSYTHWWISKKQDNILIHIDAHSDLYRNSHKDLRKLSNSEIGCYNYIWYGIRDGYVNEVYWVIPDSLKGLMEPCNASTIINKNLISEVYRNEGGLHIKMECIVASGETKHVPIHICTVDMLPELNTVCDKVTLATSPEFIPASADELVFEYLQCFGAGRDTALNLYNQHKSMIDKTPEEFEAAWDKINKKEDF